MEEEVDKKSIQHVEVPHNMRISDNLDYKVQYLYLRLKKYMNGQTKSCYPSLETLSKDSGISVSTIRKYLKILEEHGHIEIRKRKGRFGNEYIFNTNSDLYTGFEMFSMEFLDTPIIENREKAAYVALQERMYKDGDLGKITGNAIDLSQYLGVSLTTYKNIERNLISAGVLSITKTNAIDEESKTKKNLYILNLELIGQAILYNQNKLSEHEERLDKIEQTVEDLKKQIKEKDAQIEELKKTNKILVRKRNEEQVKEIEDKKHIQFNII